MDCVSVVAYTVVDGAIMDVNISIMLSIYCKHSFELFHIYNLLKNIIFIPFYTESLLYSGPLHNLHLTLY